MTQAITQVDGTFENRAMNGDEKNWNANPSRWTKGDNDRLYLNGSDHVDYVDLDSLYVWTDGARVSGTAEREGDLITVEVSLGDDEKVWTATFRVGESGNTDADENADDDTTEDDTQTDAEPKHEFLGGLADSLDDEESDETEAEEDGDQESAEVVADGGADQSAHFAEEHIERALADHTDPDHPKSPTTDDVRDALATIQRGIVGHWAGHMDALEEGSLELVGIDDDVLVFAEHSGHEWGDIFDAEDIDHPGLRSALVQAHHSAATAITDFTFETADALVVRRPESFNCGQHFAESLVNHYLARGLAPGQAWAVWGVHVRGNSRNMWASRMGRNDHSQVSEALRKAEEKVHIPFAE